MSTTVSTTTCPLDCPDACGALAEVDATGRLVRLRGNPRHSWSRGSLCGKTSIYHELVNAPNRLSQPLVRDARGQLVPASWEEALSRIARGLAGLAGSEVLALSYAGNMGLVARGFPMRLMHALGATTTDGGICDNTATAGYEAVLGHVVGPDVEEAAGADLLVIWGCDARRTAPHLLSRAREVARRRGAALVAIDIYETDTLRQVREWGGRGLVLRPGSDAALALALTRLSFERGAADEAFLAQHCVGAQELRAELSRSGGLDEAAAATGLERAAIEELYGLLASARRPFVKVGVGWTRRRYGGTSMRAVCVLTAVLGHPDRLHYESSDHFGLDTSSIQRPDLVPTGATTERIRHVELGSELEGDRFRAVFVWGHNPVVTVPDAGRVRAGLARRDLLLVVHELFMTETAALADVVLPATASVESSDVYRSYGHRLLHYARRASKPPAQQRSNVATFAALAQRLDLGPELWDASEEGLCEELLEANRGRIGEPALERLRAGEPVKLAPRAFADRGTPSGKIELASSRALAAGEPALPVYRPDLGSTRGAFWLVAAPSIATHNSTFSHVTRHRARAGAPRVHVAPGDAAALGVGEGMRVRVANEQGALELPVTFDAGLPRGVVRIDGLPLAEDLGADAGVNLLSSPAISDLGEGNVLYSTRVDLTPGR